MTRSADILRRCFDAATRAAAPSGIMSARLRSQPAPRGPCFILSVGKAATGMAGALVAWLESHGREPAGGLIVGTDQRPSPHHALASIVGDHPFPGSRSAEAAELLESTIAAIPASAEVHIAISGGTSSLIGAPIDRIDDDDFASAFRLLLDAGLDIDRMNAIRKRFCRWTAGRLALRLAPRISTLWLISDVPGDDPSVIGSGPCTGDRWTVAGVRQVVDDHGLAKRLPSRVLEALSVDTAKPDDPRFAKVTTVLVASNQTAMLAAAKEAEAIGYAATLMDAPLQGDAAEMGESIALAMRRSTDANRVLIWGGETTVQLPAIRGRGGRSQELALAAARVLARDAVAATILAGGTDGRDGMTDAAGAVVDQHTWSAIDAAGRAPDIDLAGHNAYDALDAANALVRTGPTGTNVMDVVLGISE